MRAAFFCVGDSLYLKDRFGADPDELLMKAENNMIMLALADCPRTLEELCNELNTRREDVEQGLEILLAARLVKRVDDKYATTIPVISNKKAASIARYLKGLVDRLARYLEENVDRLEGAFMRTELSRNYSWEEVAHIVVDALLMDFSFLNCVEEQLLEKGLYKDWTEDQLLIPYFGLELGVHQVNLGVNSYLLNGYGVSIMHATFIDRDPPLPEIIRTVSEGKKHICKLLEGTPPQKLPEGLLKMGLVKLQKGGVTLKVPVVNAKDREVITETVLSLGYELAEIFMSDYNVVRRSFDELGYSKWLKGIGDYAELIFHQVMGLTVLELMRREILPPVPEKAPACWGTWLWQAPWTLDLRIMLSRGLGLLERLIMGNRGLELLRKDIERARRLVEEGQYFKASEVMKRLRREVVKLLSLVSSSHSKSRLNIMRESG